MDYALVKTIHILSSTLLFGTGLGSAYYLWRAHLEGDTRAVASVVRHVVQADWIFTTPTIVIQPLTGAWLVHAGGYPWSGWVAASIALFIIAGACWLPVVWLQLRMRDLAAQSAVHDSPLSTQYWRYARIWFWLGVPAFAAIVGVFFLMVFKPVF